MCAPAAPMFVHVLQSKSLFVSATLYNPYLSLLFPKRLYAYEKVYLIVLRHKEMAWCRHSNDNNILWFRLHADGEIDGEGNGSQRLGMDAISFCLMGNNFWK